MNFPYPTYHLTPLLMVNPFKFLDQSNCRNLVRVLGLSVGEDAVTLGWAI